MPGLSLGTLFERSFGVYKASAGKLFAASAAWLVAVGGVGWILKTLGAHGTLVGLFALAWFLFTVSVLAGLVIRIVEASYRGTSAGSFSDLFSSLKGRIWPLFWVYSVTVVLIFIALLALVIPGIVVWAVLPIALPAIVIERISWQAFERSFKLAIPHFWMVLAWGLIIEVLSFLAVVAIFIAVGGSGFLLMGTGVGAGAGTAFSVILFFGLVAILLPSALVAWSVLYFELAELDRIRTPQQPGGMYSPQPPPPASAPMPPVPAAHQQPPHPPAPAPQAPAPLPPTAAPMPPVPAAQQQPQPAQPTADAPLPPAHSPASPATDAIDSPIGPPAEEHTTDDRGITRDANGRVVISFDD